MKILHITRSLIKTSGVSVFIAEMANIQAELGHEVTVVIRWKPFYGVSKKVQLVVDHHLWHALKSIGRPDVVHIHGLWFDCAIAAMLWCVWHKVPFVVSPHGSFMPRVFTVSPVKKRLVYRLLLKPLVNRAKTIHCTGEAESAAVAVLGLKPPCFVVPLGCHLPKWPIEPIPGEKKKILFLSRLGEEKGLLTLLEAWRQVKQSGNQEIKQYTLILAGPDWRGYRAVLERKIAKENIKDVIFAGNADEKMKDELYRSADFFVLPSPMENFSMVVLDALAYGVPVICTKGTPWKCIEEAGCGWWIEPNSVSDLSEGLLKAVSRDAEERLWMKTRARELALNFDWYDIARKTLSAYL